MTIDEAQLSRLTDLVDQLQRRFYGKYRGTVTDVDTATLRIKAKVPDVLGTTPTGWCQVCVPFAGKAMGMFFIPDVGSAVWIEFEGGNPSMPIWVGCFWRSDELPEDASPAVRGIVTHASHSLLFDDDADEVTLSDAGGGKLAFTSDGVTTSRGGKSVTVGDASVSLNDGAFEVS